MKRIQYHQYGGPDQMRLEEFELARLRPSQITVRVKAASVNKVDWRYRVVFGTQTPDLLTKLAELAATGRFRSAIGKIVPLSGAITAITELERRGTPKGKLVIIQG